MLVVTTDGIPGYDIVAVFGAVTGTVLQSTHGFLGPQPQAVAETLANDRREAIGWMVADARQSRANAVVGMRMDSIQTNLGVEYCAYGTAVWAVPVTEDAKRLYGAMAHEGRVPPLTQYEDMIRGINATID